MKKSIASFLAITIVWNSLPLSAIAQQNSQASVSNLPGGVRTLADLNLNLAALSVDQKIEFSSQLKNSLGELEYHTAGLQKNSDPAAREQEMLAFLERKIIESSHNELHQAAYLSVLNSLVDPNSAIGPSDTNILTGWRKKYATRSMQESARQTLARIENRVRLRPSALFDGDTQPSALTGAAVHSDRNKIDLLSGGGAWLANLKDDLPTDGADFKKRMKKIHGGFTSGNREPRIALKIVWSHRLFAPHNHQENFIRTWTRLTGANAKWFAFLRLRDGTTFTPLPYQSYAAADLGGWDIVVRTRKEAIALALALAKEKSIKEIILHEDIFSTMGGRWQDLLSTKHDSNKNGRMDHVPTPKTTRGESDLPVGDEWTSVMAHVLVPFKVLNPVQGLAGLFGLNSSNPMKWRSTRIMGIQTVFPSPDGKHLFTGIGDKIGRMWDIATEIEIARFDNGGNLIHSITLSPDGRYLYLGSIKRNVRKWDVVTRNYRDFADHTNMTLPMISTPDGKYLLTGGLESNIRMWDVETGLDLRQFADRPTNQITSLTSPIISSDGRYLFAGASDNAVQMWDVPSGQPLRRIGGADVENVPLVQLIGADAMKSIYGKYWKDAYAVRPWNAGSSIRSIALSADQKSLFVASSDNTLIQWDFATGMEVRRFAGHTENIISLLPSPDGTHLFTTSPDTFGIWDITAGKEVRRFRDRMAPAVLSSDGKQLFAFSVSGYLRTIDIESLTKKNPETGLSGIPESAVSDENASDLPVGDEWASVAKAIVGRMPKTSVQGLAASTGGLTPANVSRLDLNTGSGSGSQGLDPAKAKVLRGELRPLVQWMMDFHIEMRRKFPKADFSMRDSDVFLNYVRAMRQEKTLQPDPDRPAEFKETISSQKQIIESAARYVYRDRIGLGNPEDSNKRDAARHLFDQILAQRIQAFHEVPDSALQALPTSVFRARLHKPYEELYQDYLKIFPELAAANESFAQDSNKKRVKFIRDPKNLPTVEERIHQIKSAVTLGDPLLLLGDSAVSKSFLIKAYNETIANPYVISLGRPPIPLVSIGVKPNMGGRELKGRYGPKPRLESKDGTTRATQFSDEFAYLAGHLVRSMILGHWLTLEEITNAQPEFLEVINFYLTHGYLIIHEKGGKPLIIYPNPRFRLFATGNWTHFEGRNSQSEAFWSRWRVKIWESYTVEELGYIIAAKYGFEEGLARMMVLFQEAVSVAFKAETFGKKLHGMGKRALNFRTLEMLAGRYTEDLAKLGGDTLSAEDKLRILAKEAYEVYGAMLTTKTERETFLDIISKSFKLTTPEGGKVVISDKNLTSDERALGSKLKLLGLTIQDLAPEIVEYKDTENEILFKEKALGEFRFRKGPGGEMVPGPEHRLTLTPQVLSSLFLFLHSWQRREPYLWVGRRSAGKTRVPFFAAHLMRMPVFYIAHSQESNLKEMAGGFYPRTDAGDDASKSEIKLPPMVWIDGKQAQAMEWGKGNLPEDQVGAWLFEDDVNLGSTHEHRNTVTDNGELSTPYRQVHAGPNFWEIASVNPPDPLRNAGRKMLSPAYLSRRHIAYQEEMDAPSEEDSAAGASKSLVETALDRLIGDIRWKEPVQGLAAAVIPLSPANDFALKGRPLSSEESEKIRQAIEIMKNVPVWAPLYRLLKQRPPSMLAGALYESSRIFGGFQHDSIYLDERMLREASLEFIATIMIKETSHYEESLIHRKLFSQEARFWMEEGEKMELFRSNAGWLELGRPIDKDYKGYLEGEHGLVPQWLRSPHQAETAMMIAYHRIAQTIDMPFWNMSSLTRWMADEVSRGASQWLGDLKVQLTALAQYYEQEWIIERDHWIKKHKDLFARAHGPPPKDHSIVPSIADSVPTMRSGPTGLALATRHPKEVISDFLKLFPNLPTQDASALRDRLSRVDSKTIQALDKLVHFKDRLRNMAVAISRIKNIQVRYTLEELTPGVAPYRYRLSDKSILLNAWALLRDIQGPGGELKIFGTLDHEAGHGIVSQYFVDAEKNKTNELEDNSFLQFFFGEETNHLLLNGFEDVRMENWVLRHFPGAELDLEAFYQDFMRGEIYRPELEKLPHLQYVLGVIYWAKSGQIAPFVTDPDAQNALQQSSPYFQEIFNTLPPGYSLEAERHKPYAWQAAEKIKKNIYSFYEPLVRKSIENTRNTNGSQQKGGRDSQEGNSGKGSQSESSEEEARQKVQEISKELADKLAPQEDGGDGPGQETDPARLSENLNARYSPLEDKSDKENGQQTSRNEDSQKPDSSKETSQQKDTVPPGTGHASERKPDPMRQLLEDIESGLYEHFSGLSDFEARLTRLTEPIERLTGLLANVFYKNADPDLSAQHYEDGDEVDMDRLIDIVAGKEVDLAFWQRLKEYTKRHFKVKIILDLSGSMKTFDAQEGVLDTSVMFTKVDQSLGIDDSIDGFDHHMDLGHQYYPLKPWGEILDTATLAKLETKIKVTGGGSTSDGDALKDGLEDMKKQDADRRIIFFITDGAGNAGAYKIPDLLDEAKQHNIEVVGVGVGFGMDEVKQTFAKAAYILAPSAEQLPEPMGELLLRNVWAAFDSEVDTHVHIDLSGLDRSVEQRSLISGLAAAFQLSDKPEPMKKFVLDIPEPYVSAPFTDFAFSNNSSKLIALDRWRHIWVWSMLTGERLENLYVTHDQRTHECIVKGLKIRKHDVDHYKVAGRGFEVELNFEAGRKEATSRNGRLTAFIDPDNGHRIIVHKYPWEPSDKNLSIPAQAANKDIKDTAGRSDLPIGDDWASVAAWLVRKAISDVQGLASAFNRASNNE